jgi:hypothetical protein
MKDENKKKNKKNLTKKEKKHKKQIGFYGCNYSNLITP